MKWYSFLPYYSDFKVGGLLACAYVTAIASLALTFGVSKLFRLKMSFEQLACFCLLACGALWLMPVCSFIPEKYSNYFLLGTLFIYIAFLNVIYDLQWKETLIIWSAYAAVQIGFYLYIINNF